MSVEMSRDRFGTFLAVLDLRNNVIQGPSSQKGTLIWNKNVLLLRHKAVICNTLREMLAHDKPTEDTSTIF
jgi:hypothetical protein